MLCFVLCAIGLLAAGGAAILLKFRIQSPVWSVHVYRSSDCVKAPEASIWLGKPTITARDVRDVPAEFVADPFLFVHEGTFYLFFEVLNKASGRGEIGYAESEDGMNWTYCRMVLQEPFHLSYPQILAWNGEIYMLPESVEADRVLLYRAKQFPTEWEVAAELLEARYTDPTCFAYDGRFWMFAGHRGTTLQLFSSDRPDQGWKEHPCSPLITQNKQISRPAGNVVAVGNRLYRYAQDATPYYGKQVHMAEITLLTETDYEERVVESVLQGSGTPGDWRCDGMHHVAQLQLPDGEWLIAVDGHRFETKRYLLWKLDRLYAKFAYRRQRKLQAGLRKGVHDAL